MGSRWESEPRWGYGALGGGLRGPEPWVGYRALGLEAVMWPWGGLQGLQSLMGYGVLGLG